MIVKVSSARALSCTNSTTHSPNGVCVVAVLRGPSGGSNMTRYSARPNSFIRLTASGVTPEKVRLLDITMTSMFDRDKRRVGERVRAMRIPALEVVKKPADLPQRRMSEFPRLPAGPARQPPRATRSEDKSAGDQTRRTDYARCDNTDHPRGDQNPAGLSRQLLDAQYQLLVDRVLLAGQFGGLRNSEAHRTGATVVRLVCHEIVPISSPLPGAEIGEAGAALPSSHHTASGCPATRSCTPRSERLA